MIDEHHEELAAMYVLGMLEPDETAAFEAKMRANPELCKFVDGLLHSSAAMVHAVPAKSAPSHLKEKVIREICGSKVPGDSAGKMGEGSKVVAFPRAPFPWLPWAIAAGFMVMCGLLFSDRTKLLAQISDLEGRNDVCQMRVSLMDPAGDSHSRATIVWDSSSQTGVLEGDMPRPAANEDYQLWVVGDSNPEPVNAGLISVDEKGEAKAIIRLKQKVSPSDKFAITVEKKGGMPQPHSSPVMVSKEK